MSEKLKPVRCGCGGEAVIYVTHWWGKCYVCECDECGMASRPCTTEAEAIRAWNRAMGAEKMPTTNMTILHRKIDLLSILQAIKSDKIRVWMSYDGKIRFRNTKTGNEIEINPYYDMEGEEYHE